MIVKDIKKIRIVPVLLIVLFSCSDLRKPASPASPEPEQDLDVAEATVSLPAETIERPPLPELKADDRGAGPEIITDREISPAEPEKTHSEPQTVLPEPATEAAPIEEKKEVPVREIFQESAEVKEPEAEEKEIIVSEEVYKDTFSRIEILIKELNVTIRKGDYSKWLTYLTEEYKRKYDNASVLAELSESPILKDRAIKLKSIQDYFNFVVVPSRTGTLLNKIVFTGEDHIRAVTVVQEVPVILYSLRKENGVWKVATE